MSRRLRIDLGKRAAAFVPIFVLGFSQAALVAYVAFVAVHAVYIHSNTRWRFPVLRWLIATPESYLGQLAYPFRRKSATPYG